MRAREGRFIGNGNMWLGEGRQYRGWKIACHRCGAVKTISSHHGSTLAPDLIVKKLAQSGWYVGNKQEEDTCVNCRRKKPKPGNGADHTPLPEIDATNPANMFKGLVEMLTLAKVAVHANQLNRAVSIINGVLRVLERTEAALLEIFEAEGRREARRETKAAVLPPASKPEPAVAPPQDTDDDYQRWLAELDKTREK